MPSTTTSYELDSYFQKEWKELCDHVETWGRTGQFLSKYVLRKLVINAPVLLLFVLLCVVIYLISTLVPATRPILGVHDTWNTFRVLQYPSLITHILAHSSYDHLRGNMTHLLLTGPAVEHIFGSFNLVLILLVVAIVSALVHICVGKANTYQLGASGVVFACILLNSLVSASSGKIPVAFVITTTLYLGDELWKFVFPTDNVSHHAHLTGGLVGAVAGFYIHQKRRKAKSDTLANKYLKVMMQGIQKKTATKKKK